MNDNKWLDFFAGGNTIMVRNEQEFNKFRDFIEDLGIRSFFKKDRTFADWQYLSIINNHDPNCIIFEYQPFKGMTFGYTVEESKEWYGQEPFNVNVVDYFYKNSRLFEKDNHLSKDLEEEIEK